MKRAMFAALLGLAGCSGGPDTSNSQAAQVSTYVSILRASRATPSPLPTLTPALIDSLTVPSLEVMVEDSGLTAFLVPLSDRPDGVRIWRSADDAQVVLRGGVLIATRGLGNDPGSAEVGAAVKAVQVQLPVSGPHELFVKTGDNGIDRIALRCESRTLGPKTIEIVQRPFAVVHLQSNCTGAGEVITNDYWVDRRDSAVLQSRQWAGPEIGYVRTRLLRK